MAEPAQATDRIIPSDARREVAARYLHGPRKVPESHWWSGVNAVQGVLLILADLGLRPGQCWAGEVMAGGKRLAIFHAARGGHRDGRIVAFVEHGLSKLDINLALMCVTGGDAA